MHVLISSSIWIEGLSTSEAAGLEIIMWTSSASRELSYHPV